jgi:hypothetical protein
MKAWGTPPRSGEPLGEVELGRTQFEWGRLKFAIIARTREAGVIHTTVCLPDMDKPEKVGADVTVQLEAAKRAAAPILEQCKRSLETLINESLSAITDRTKKDPAARTDRVSGQAQEPANPQRRPSSPTHPHEDAKMPDSDPGGRKPNDPETAPKASGEGPLPNADRPERGH